VNDGENPWVKDCENPQQYLLDPANPFSQMLAISNQGYVPLTDVEVDCVPKFDTSRHIFFDGMTVHFGNVAHYLPHAGLVTVPCFAIPELYQIKGGYGVPPGATLEITVNYAFYHANLKALRRSQHFRFESVQAADKSQHWAFLP